ncbi:MAG: AMP-binding protein, partial [Hyphomonas sp.]|nr:AMP-binding protein [Hyphomonas sp.]
MIDIEAMPFLADVPRVQAVLRPDDTAFWFEGEETSFHELDVRSNQVANGLISLGVQPQDRVGYLAKNTSQYYEMLYGCAKARAVMTAVNTRLAAPEVTFILSDAGARVLFVGKEFYDMAEQIRDELPDIVEIIAIDGGHPEWPAYDAWRDAQSTTAPRRKPLPDDDVIQLYTSGTTGLPKGVQLTNQNYRALFEQARQLEWSSYDPRDVVMNAMPLFHVAGVNLGIL